MYPASRLVRPDPRSSIVPKLLALVAAVVLLVAVLEVFYVLRPTPPYLVQGGRRTAGCVSHFGMVPHPGDPGYRRFIRDACHTVVPNQRVFARSAVGVGTVVLVGLIAIGATRAARRGPALS